MNHFKTVRQGQAGFVANRSERPRGIVIVTDWSDGPKQRQYHMGYDKSADIDELKNIRFSEYWVRGTWPFYELERRYT